ncbi:hypothetical protein CPAR01_04090 [Colletotrichum paranaense]|uniref:Uncharacterized protein n=2 Tax=Colletotrichum acutatum species complex TaxID=2707335 RepID=A0AAI9V732_9PEZI|nr:hypothetical protein CMEL01_00685 [Colletotrichum melonis]KAK1543457.1 hypothetical protein CPAR01_04090 [Colletotrichum paranaense]
MPQAAAALCIHPYCAAPPQLSSKLGSAL